MTRVPRWLQGTGLVALSAGGLALVALNIPFVPANLPSSGAHAQVDDVQIMTDDIPRFWAAYDAAKSAPDRQAVFERMYLKPGSVGLRDFRQVRSGDVAALGQVTSHEAELYDALRPTSLTLGQDHRVSEAVRACLRRFQGLYPAARFQNVYLVVGSFSTGGTTGRRSLLIGSEFFSRPSGLRVQSQSSWINANLRPLEALPFIITHELMHALQRRTLLDLMRPTLLRQALDEGGADFLAALACDRPPSGAHYDYGPGHEPELWAEFQTQMHGTDLRQWFYQGDRSKDRPADLGYFVGHQIVRAYYEQAADKRQAVADILNFRNPEAFLKASGYAP